MEKYWKKTYKNYLRTGKKTLQCETWCWFSIKKIGTEVDHSGQVPLQGENTKEITVCEKVITGSNSWKLQSDKFELEIATIMRLCGERRTTIRYVKRKICCGESGCNKVSISSKFFIESCTTRNILAFLCCLRRSCGKTPHLLIKGGEKCSGRL